MSYKRVLELGEKHKLEIIAKYGIKWRALSSYLVDDGTVWLPEPDSLRKSRGKVVQFMPYRGLSDSKKKDISICAKADWCGVVTYYVNFTL